MGKLHLFPYFNILGFTSVFSTPYLFYLGYLLLFSMLISFYSQYLTYLKYQWVKYIFSYLISPIFSFLSVLSFLSYQASIFSFSHSFKISKVSIGKLYLFLYFKYYSFFFHFKVLFYSYKNNFER